MKYVMGKIKKTVCIMIAAAAIICSAGCTDTKEDTAAGNKDGIEDTSDKADDKIHDSKNDSQSEKPNEYNVFLEVDTEKKTITGVEKVKVTNNSEDEWNEVYFSTFINAFSDVENAPVFDKYKSKVYKYGNDTGRIGIINTYMLSEEVPFKNERTALEVDLKEPLKPGAETEVTIHFEAKIPHICHRTGYNDYAMWLGNFIPNLCVYDGEWEKYDYYPAGEPAYTTASNYNVNIKVPRGYTVIGSGNAKKEENDESTTYSFSPKMVRDFVFAVSDKYKKDSIVTQDGIEINYYHYSDGMYGDTPIEEKYLDMAKRSIEYYGSKVGPYPYDTLNIAEVELWGDLGMEYPEMIFLDSGYIKNEYSVTSIAHEAAHQWFYNVIGNDQYSSAWRYEGMANAVELGVYMDKDEIYNDVKKRYYELREEYYDGRDYEGGYVVQRDVSSFDSWGTYYYSEYEKPMIMIYELKRKMGEDKFDRFLKNYYNKFSFKTADRAGFIKCAEDSCGEELDDFFEEWLDEKGVPEIEWEEG
ncbi:MAG: M1 family metallopeptidase [Firmicutes bacterium]|nr:M1 family metallopeptidase [Bacillota bacterium]